LNDVPDNRVIAEAELEATRRTRRIDRLRRLRLPLMLAAPALVILGLVYFFVFGGRYVSTDDAYVGAGRVAVSAAVPGRIVAVNVHDNQTVTKGEVLVRLDGSDYKAALERARAQLAAAKLQVAALRASYEQSLTDLQNAEDYASYAAKEKAREQNLLKAGVSSQQDYTKAANTADEAQHRLNAARQAVAKALANLGGQPDLPDARHPQVMQAQAQLDKAEIDLADTKVTAAVDGVVTKVDQVQVGSYANTAQTLFWLVSNKRWVEANFKENQLTHLRPGEAATITLDAYPGQKIKARVASFSPGTGSSFSLLPPENATGNWVKVTQRLPVRLEILNAPSDIVLASGLSAHVTVDTHSTPDNTKAADAKP
jgi:membrane fusion protein (multidrug efflux system)